MSKKNQNLPKNIQKITAKMLLTTKSTGITLKIQLLALYTQFKF